MSLWSTICVLKKKMAFCNHCGTCVKQAFGLLICEWIWATDITKWHMKHLKICVAQASSLLVCVHQSSFVLIKLWRNKFKTISVCGTLPWLRTNGFKRQHTVTHGTQVQLQVSMPPAHYREKMELYRSHRTVEGVTTTKICLCIK